MDSTSECPTCGGSFSSELGVKMHHAKTHGASIAGEPVDCENCGSTIRKKSNQIEEWDKHFCGDECRLEYTRGENHHQYDRSFVVCDNCGDKSKKRPSRIEGREHNFCDMSCRDEFYEESGMWSDENSPSWEGGDIKSVCKYCDSEYEHIKSRETKFCSMSCKGKWMSENKRGDDAPNWKGGRTDDWSLYYTKEFRDNRERVINRDNGCVVCGEKEVDVHHIKPLRDISKNPENLPDWAHSMENLVCLCKTHHRKYEGKHTELTASEFIETVK